VTSSGSLTFARSARGFLGWRIIIVAFAIAVALAPMPARIVETWYSRGLYAHLQRLVTAISSLLPVAVLDVAVIVLLTVGVAGFARRWRRYGARAAMVRSMGTIVVAAAVIYIWFLLFWGLNYRRVPLEQKLPYDAARITRERAVALGRFAVEQANALRASNDPLVDADDEGLSHAFATIVSRIVPVDAGQPPVVGSAPVVAPPKPSLLGWYLRKAAIDGMTNPFFLEVILNPDLLPHERPFVLAHEWAHLAGYADESEANFVAWLTCVNGTPAARYSGWLAAYELVSFRLPSDDRRLLASLMSPAVVADISAAHRRLAAASRTVQVAARGAYDTYLKANRIDEGLANYSAAVRLMLGTTRDENWTPTLR
jgi:hypothetical protein